MEDEKREESENTETSERESEDAETAGRSEKTEKSIDNNPDKFDVSKIKEKVKSNPWMIVSIVLLVAVIVLLVINFRGGITGNVVSEDVASKKILDFADSQGIAAELVEVNKKSGLYEVILSMQGRKVPVYITLDGENLVSGLTPLGIITQQTQQEPVEVPKSDKPKVELFVMTHCPYGTQAEKGMIPVFELLGDKIDGAIRFIHYFMHEGEKQEPYETPIQVCIREEQADKYLDYLTCFLEDGDSDRCLKETKIDEAKLNLCKSGKADDYYDLDSALSQGYGVSGSPSLVINGQKISSGRSPAAYLETICSAFNNAPEECNEELSTATPSPMWGYEEGSDTQAQC